MRLCCPSRWRSSEFRPGSELPPGSELCLAPALPRARRGRAAGARRTGRESLLCAAGLAATVLGGGCNPYERHSGEYLAGSVDPVNFPPAYLGQDGDAKKPGSGTFQYVTARVRRTTVSYYPLPFIGVQAASDDPLALSAGDLPLAYVFDPVSGPLTGAGDGAGADSTRCIKPQGYAFDELRRREEAVRLDRQGNIFTALPADSDPAGSTTYVPVVREVVVTSNGNPCQDAKSEANLLGRSDVVLSLGPPPEGIPDALPVARPSGRLLALAIIDPAADVRLADPDKPYDPMTMLGPQRWGFYAQYLLAYLDGGYIPQQIVHRAGDPADRVRLLSQDLYYPSMHIVDAKGTLGKGDVGQGFDLIQHRRGEDGYSPVCRVLAFDPKDPKKPETAIADIDPAKVSDTGRYIYCLQLP